MSSFTRRAALAGTGAAGMAAALAACAPPNPGNINAEATIPPSDGPVTVTYWAWLKDLQKVADVFNETQDRIRVEATWIPGGNTGGYAKILSAVAAGGGPDIAQVELRQVPEFALAGALVDLTRYGFAEQADAFDPGAISQVKVGDSYWAVPQDTGPVATFYNREVLEDELGLQAPATWDEFRETAGIVSEAGKKLISLDPSDGSHPIAWAMQTGAVWFRPEGDGWIVDMTDDASMRMAEFWDGILADKIIGTGYGSYTTPWYAAAGDGNVLASISGSWSDALNETVPGGSGKWAVAPMPRWDDGYASGGHGGSSAAVLSTSQHPVEALEFLTWMCTDPAGIDAMIEFSGIGWSPAKDYIGEIRQQPSEFFSGQNYNEEVIVPMAEGQNLDWTWAPMMQRAQAIIGDGMTNAVSGEVPLVDMFANSQKEIVKIMRDMGLDAEEAR
ncbi:MULTISPECIES: ABC transporter substrate-binding protein [Brachybacterium]|uniref:ABC transporter substrate-binding protein n=1 Tax=Brachybacterium alimentarium TaxID=47845 RepID=A0A2A3YMR2_9MICO|nr:MULTISPECIES: extracellular solute-binding protein [Brachybacterium]PCC40573.1 ABC transporter substrate-binding protein [Brachybacterium alimentarium]RCS61720.1 extracellular solute-binding protein [Brachybacterium sp. JB7]RCS65966.1 extracellular solute-binding protein [Brachybacterium alimentarium]RCS75860.1 extracellular solute-binding protein [Brachybacterium alimentarium]RCS92514.1 extracellular solute-binding protein [Brachybacterium alimentarium]